MSSAGKAIKGYRLAMHAMVLMVGAMMSEHKKQSEKLDKAKEKLSFARNWMGQVLGSLGEEPTYEVVDSVDKIPPVKDATSLEELKKNWFWAEKPKKEDGSIDEDAVEPKLTLLEKTNIMRDKISKMKETWASFAASYNITKKYDTFIEMNLGEARFALGEVLEHLASEAKTKEPNQA